MTIHPDFEGLSAHLDGEAPEWEAHVAGCAECRATLDRLRAVSGMVAGPVPVPGARREQALAAALEAFEDAESGQDDVTGGAAGDRRRPAVVAAASGPSRPPLTRPRAGPVTPITAATRGGGRRRWARGGSGVWIGLGSAAAVVVAFLVGFGVLAGGGGGDHGATVAAGGPGGQERVSTALSDASRSNGGAGVAGAGGAQGIDGGDLGEIPDASVLAARAGPALVARDTAAAGVESAPPTGDSSPFAGPDSGNVTAAPSAGVPAPKAVGTRPCEIEARAARPDLGAFVYYATGRVDGVPVVVLGFAPVSAPGPVTLLALAQAEGCRTVLAAAGP